MSSRRPGLRLPAGILVLIAVCLALPAGAQDPEALVLDYSPLLDRSALTHSGQTVGEVLALLALPEGDAARGPQTDETLHMLVDPLLEPYAHVLSDAIAAGDREGGERILVEVAALFAEGEPQPAWVDLLRTRRYVLQSDGEGFLRAFAPGPDAESAWRDSYGVLRLPLAAERARLGPEAPMSVEVYAYEHERLQSRFRLHRPPVRVEIGSEVPPPPRPPLDLETLERFLSLGLRIDGARITEDGGLVLFGSAQEPAPTLDGRPVELSDLSAAYRAVFLSEGGHPYMSLDRSPYPEWAAVNYGGRLRDTRLGLVTLRSDIRFKTFSQGFDFLSGEDMRETIRARVPEFLSHMERFASAAGAREVRDQQTRLWFYPDSVRLALSPTGDTLYIRSARMTAAAERMSGDAAGRQDPPWTRATTAEINADYEGLASLFPELRELDTVARLLSLFAWLKQAEDEGLLLPDLDALLSVELPPARTPRGLPQLLVFTALDRASETPLFVSADRSGVADRMGRLRPRGGRAIPPGERLRRALADLPTRLPAQQQARERFEQQAAGVSGPEERLRLAYEAERFWMHNRVIYHVDRPTADAVVRRERAGGLINVFSTAIGGLDLDMGGAVEKAWRGGDSEEPRSGDAQIVRRAVTPPPGGWPDSLAGRPAAPLPAHGSWEADERATTAGTVRLLSAPAAAAREARDGQGRLLWRRLELHPGTEEQRVIELGAFPGARSPVFLRHEEGRTVRYGIGPEDGALVARPWVPPSSADLPASATASVSGAPVTPWDLGPSWNPLLGREGDTTLLGLAGDPAGQRAVGPDAGAVASGPQARARFAARVREAVAAHSTPALRLAHLALDSGQRELLLQLGAEEVRLPVAEMRALLFGEGPAETFNEALRGVGASRLALYRDGAWRRPPWADPGIRGAVEEDPVLVMAALNGRGSSGAPVAITSRPEGAAQRLASLPRVTRGADLGLVLPSRWPAGESEQVAALRGRLVGAGVWLGEAPSAEAPPVLLVPMGRSPAARAERLRAWGRLGLLRGRVLLLLPLHAPLEPALAEELLTRHGCLAVYLTAEALEAEAVRRAGAALARMLVDGPEGGLLPDRLLAEAASRAAGDPELGRRMRDEVLRLRRGGFAF